MLEASLAMRIPLLVSLALLAVLAAPVGASTGASVPVVAAGFSFLSPVVVVPLGTSITWTGAALPHTVTTSADALSARGGVANDPTGSDGNPDTFAQNLPQGSSYTHTFATGGVFYYHCELHHTLGMIGAVVVIDPDMLP